MTDTEEVWKTYPDYNFIEVSNLGRVRTKDRTVTRSDGRKQFIKGRFLKQQRGRGGYMYVHFRVSGRSVNLLVHRMIAITFIPNPNNYPEVNHIDNDRTNNVVSNLEWCTRKYNEAYKKNFGTSVVEVLGRPVFAVNLETGNVLWFETRSEASRQLGISNSQICAVIKGKLNQAGGYWFTENESEITEEKIQEIKDNMRSYPVIAVNPETSEVFRFKSQSEAARQLDISQGYINGVIKGLYNKAKGWWYCYADKNVVEETRKKFGDEVACKVEELMKQNQNQ